MACSIRRFSPRRHLAAGQVAAHRRLEPGLQPAAVRAAVAFDQVLFVGVPVDPGQLPVHVGMDEGVGFARTSSQFSESALRRRKLSRSTGASVGGSGVRRASGRSAAARRFRRLAARLGFTIPCSIA